MANILIYFISAYFTFGFGYVYCAYLTDKSRNFNFSLKNPFFLAVMIPSAIVYLFRFGFKNFKKELKHLIDVMKDK